MSSPVTTTETFLSRAFDSFIISYDSITLNNATTPGTSCQPYILCYDKQELVGIILFYETQPPPVNNIRGSDPHYRLHIHFHISQFNDIINILRYHKPLALKFDFIKKDGTLQTITNQQVGAQG